MYSPSGGKTPSLWKNASVATERITTKRKPATIAQTLCPRRRGWAVAAAVEDISGLRVREMITRGAGIVLKSLWHANGKKTPNVSHRSFHMAKVE